MDAVTADVIVVGGGGSALAAAAEAAKLGRSVILLEKNRRLGGSTAWSVGSVSASNTPHQRKALAATKCRFAASLLRDRRGRADCCFMDTVIISRGRSFPDVGPAVMPHCRLRDDGRARR